MEQFPLSSPQNQGEAEMNESRESQVPLIQQNNYDN